jgi:ABC-2 type transport system permease protein
MSLTSTAPEILPAAAPAAVPAAAPAPKERMNWRRVRTVVRNDLRQLLKAKDFIIPMSILGGLFFVILPVLLLGSIDAVGQVGAVQQVSNALEVLPPQAQAQIQGESPDARLQYALAVFLFAPLAVIVPLTISTAVGAASMVGERERGTGEFLAHSPASTMEIYLGKLIASLIPGYATTLGGFAIYSLIVNTMVGPDVGGWFFPTRQWWLLVLWVVPPFLAGALALVLRLSARVRSTAAAQQASGLVTLPLIITAYTQSTGSLFGAAATTAWIGLVAWLVAALALWRGMHAVKRGRLLGVADEQ